MADNAWSQSVCRADTQWYGVPGQGTYYYTPRFGVHWVGGGVYQTYKSWGFECRDLGPPVKDYEWISEFGGYGQWFIGGVIVYTGGAWRVYIGDWGQTANRLGDAEPPAGAESPPVDEIPVDDRDRRLSVVQQASPA